MNLFVFEFFSAGAMADTPLAASALPEGLAMLNALLRDFSRVDDCRTMTCVQPNLSVEADEVLTVSGDWEAVFDTLASRADFALVIAPDAGDYLADLSQRAMAQGCRLLSSAPEAIRRATDKKQCGQLLRTAGIAMPESMPVSRETLGSVVAHMGFPVVVKPIFGQDCDGVSLVSSTSDLDRAMQLLDGQSEFLVQRYQPGVTASASLLVSGKKNTPLSLNMQHITPGQPFTYCGGMTPLVHPQASAALDMATGAVGCLPGLRGFVGVDMVLTDDACVVIEINPRVTVAYTGVSQSLDLNVAQAMVDAAVLDRLPENVVSKRSISFDKGGPRG
ncbi:ATP-grasp domain-containing protein [Pseudodesulfovibrio sp. JC047]|uniref:ATP-grasp domain-containing protein n=1 Tax=Pseudodesulfovibrio sp. JC047 TaxID=2683199 RepID=UPI0013D8B8AF|nr:ATP-grasp domain-containing protein [Pseudodesulfovibrio sp. JC047]NDV19444.1 ATP-grasp domain-containing protein [Pseudodesulfovibrio sp. JC047]